MFKNKRHESDVNGLEQLLCFHFSKIPPIARVILSVVYLYTELLKDLTHPLQPTVSGMSVIVEKVNSRG